MTDRGSVESDVSDPQGGSKNNSAVSSVGNLLTKLLSQPFTIVATLIVANQLGPDQQGLAAFSRALPTFVAGVSGLGISSALKYAIAKGDKTLAAVGATSVFLTLIQGVVFGFVFYCLMQIGWLGTTASRFPDWIQMTAALLVPVGLLRQTLAMGYAGNADFRIPNLISLMSGITFATSAMILVTYFQCGYASVFVSHVLAVTLATVVSSCVFVMKYRPVAKLDFGFLKFSFHYGSRAYLGTLASRGNTSLDRFFLGVLAPAKALGNYSVAVSIVSLLYFIPQAIGPVLTNRVAGAGPAEGIRVVSQVHRAIFLLQIILAVLMVVLGAIVIPILLPRFHDVPMLLVILSPGAVVYSLSLLLGAYFAGAGKPGRTSIANVSGALGSMVMYPVLVPLLGGDGAAIVCVVNYAAMYITLHALFRLAIAPKVVRLFSVTLLDVQWMIEHLRHVVAKFWNRFRGRASV